MSWCYTIFFWSHLFSCGHILRFWDLSLTLVFSGCAVNLQLARTVSFVLSCSTYFWVRAGTGMFRATGVPPQIFVALLLTERATPWFTTPSFCIRGHRPTCPSRWTHADLHRTVPTPPSGSKDSGPSARICLLKCPHLHDNTQASSVRIWAKDVQIPE